MELKINEEMGYREANVDDYTNTIAALNAFYDLYAKYDTYEAALQAKITARNDEDVKAYAGKVTAWTVSYTHLRKLMAPPQTWLRYIRT